jgi:polyhydroxyalkanoate synthesis repressor PhaR
MDNRGLNMVNGGSGVPTATNVASGVVGGVYNAAQSTQTNKNSKIIKRYQNRKLYDTHQSCYVTLDEIAEMIMRSEEVTVIDNRTKKDITSLTLTQIIFEKQKRSKTIIPVDTLRDIIQIGGGTFSGFLAKSAASGGIPALKRAKEEVTRAFSAAENLRGSFKITQRAADDLKKALNDRVQTSPNISKDAVTAANAQLQNLGSQLTNIEKLIDAIESRSTASV